MSFSSSCFSHSPISLKIIRPRCNLGTNQRFSSLRSHRTDLFVLGVIGLGEDLRRGWSFSGGSRVVIRPKLDRSCLLCRKGSRGYDSWLIRSQLADSAFTLGTVAVLPFYTLMVLAPKAELTKRLMQSSTPYVVLGLLYAYLLYLSWMPDTVRLIFASKYWLPELPGILKMFSSETTLASAWIHLLVVDLFAARHVFYDGLSNQVETRHSISLCLFFCPIGILAHVITKNLTQSAGKY